MNRTHSSPIGKQGRFEAAIGSGPSVDQAPCVDQGQRQGGTATDGLNLDPDP